VGYYIDFVFDPELVPTWQEAAKLLEKRGAEKLDNSDHPNADKFLSFRYATLPYPITIYKTLSESSKGHWVDVRLSWAQNPKEIITIIEAILRLADLLGCQVYDGQIKKYIIWDNIGEITSTFSKTANNIVGLIGVAEEKEGDEYHKGNKWLNSWIDEAFKKQISEFDLRCRHIDTVPPDIGKLIKLEILLLGINNISSLPVEIGLLQNLKYLSLMGNQFKTIPRAVFELRGLISLSLSSNKITSLDPKIGKLSNLEWFSFSGNRITSLSSEISLLNRLEYLDMTANLLKNLPPGFNELRLLKCLRLSRNRFSVLPYQVCRIKNLARLDLDGNNLSSLPPEIGNLINLEELYLHLNPLTLLPKEILNLVSLRRLRLPNFGPFADIPADIDIHNPRELLKYVFSNRLNR
jgi:Leucine-rich repeat (LRR) protein